MKGKKRIGVKQMLEWGNHQLMRTDEYATDKFKAGICTMLEEMLMSTNNYKGYYYIAGGKGEYTRCYYVSQILK